jgi:hypothetical protein
MAQSLESRINAALRSAARLKDVEAVIAAVEAEIGATQIKLDAENARSIDPALTTPQAREARNNAADLEHDIRRLNASLGLLIETRDGIVARNVEEQRQARYDAAKAERDALARNIRTRYPELAMELLSMVQRIEASDKQCAAVNQDRPEGSGHLAFAEHLARDCGYSWPMSRGGGLVLKIADMRLPLLGRDGTYLPIQANAMTGSTSFWESAMAEDQALAKEPIPGIDPEPDAAPQSRAA